MTTQQAGISAASDWLGIVGFAGKRQESCALALGVDVSEGQALLEGLRSQLHGMPAAGGPEGVSAIPVAASCANDGGDDDAACTAAALPTLLSRYPDLKILALYLSPWEAFLEACEQGEYLDVAQTRNWLSAWAAQHEALLEARSVAPGRVYLINAGRLDHVGEIRKRLRETGLLLPEQPADTQKVSCLSMRPSHAVSVLLASHMAEAGREYWSIYEALESCCVLCEREPEFQATAEIVDVRDLASVLTLAYQIQRTEEMHVAFAPEPASEAEASVDGAPAGALSDVNRENELLVLQLHQLYDELDYQVSCAAELREIVTHSGETADAARLLIAQLAKKVAESE